MCYTTLFHGGKKNRPALQAAEISTLLQATNRKDKNKQKRKLAELIEVFQHMLLAMQTQNSGRKIIIFKVHIDKTRLLVKQKVFTKYSLKRLSH